MNSENVAIIMAAEQTERKTKRKLPMCVIYLLPSMLIF